MNRRWLPALLAVALLAACALPQAQLLPLEATLGKPLEVTIYKVPT